MRITCFGKVLVLVAVFNVTPTSGQDDPADQKNWLNEKTWPTFVAARRLDVTDKDDALTKLRKERFNAGQ